MARWQITMRRWLPAAIWAGIGIAFCFILLCGLSVVVMPRLLVGGFMSDVRAGRIDEAYRRTSQSFQGYVRRADFPAYLAMREFADTNVTYTGAQCVRERILGRTSVSAW